MGVGGKSHPRPWFSLLAKKDPETGLGVFIAGV
jgi:hypothetical protein